MEKNSQIYSPDIKVDSFPKTNPVTDQSQQAPRPLTSKKYKKPLVITGIILGFVLFGIGGYFLGMQQSSQSSQSKNVPVPTSSPTTTASVTPTDSYPTPTTVSDISNGWGTFTHPVVGYSMQFPVSWSGGLSDIPEGIKQDYQDFYIESPDHSVSEGYPVLEKGAELFVRVEKTQYSTIDEIFNNDPLAPEIAFDKTTTTVNGLQAIQYDYSYEGHRATMTIFTKNGNYYSAKYRYVDDQSRQTNWDNYMRLLLSFKAK